MSPRGRSHPGTGSAPPRYPGSFLLAFREAAASLNWQTRRWLGPLVECVDAEGHSRVVGLENLYRRARRVDRAEWPALAAEFLRSVTGLDDAAVPHDLAAVAERLLLRVGTPGRPDAEAAPLWGKPLDETGLVVNLVIDDPNRMFYVTEAQVSASGRDGAAWLELAVANLAARTPAEALRVVHEESGLLLGCVGDAYDSSRALLLDRLLPETAACGALVAVPSRDELVVLPLTPRALPHVHLLKMLAEKNFRQSPYPISGEVYWAHQGTWRVVPIEVGEDEVNIQPPPELIDVLERLAPEPDDQEAGDP